MDFESHFSAEKSGEVKKTDHSPLQFDNENIDVDDILLPADKPQSIGAKIASNSADDFEHLIDESNAEFDLLGSVGGKSAGGNAPAAPVRDVFGDDFMSSSPAFMKNDDLDLLGNVEHKSKATIDFMAAERGNGFGIQTAVKPTTAPPPPPAATTKQSIYDEIENDYLNPYASSKNNEKFISSEDLLGGFNDAPPSEERNKTPDLLFKDSVATPPSPVSRKPDEPLISATKSFEPEFNVKPIVPEQPPAAAPRPTVVPKPDVSHSKVEEVVAEIKAEVKPEIKPEIKPKVEEAKPAPVPAVKKSKEQMISAEEMFCRIGLDAWFKPDRLHPRVESLIYWRDTKKSGIVFGAGLVILLAVSCFSVISVFAYSSLIVLLGTVAFRIYKNVLQAVQKTSEGHPFKDYLEFELALSQDKVQQAASVGVAHINAFLAELRRLFLVEDLVDSIKFGLLLWCLTYLGSWFNGMTLVILGFVALFTLPKVYENNKQSIDTYLDLVRSKILEITEKVKGAVPIGGGGAAAAKKAESEKDK